MHPASDIQVSGSFQVPHVLTGTLLSEDVCVFSLFYNTHPEVFFHVILIRIFLVMLTSVLDFTVEYLLFCKIC